MCSSLRLSLFLLMLNPLLAVCQSYRTGIGKTTHAVANASAALNFFLKYLPATGPAFFDNTTCPNWQHCTCGQVGRCALESPSSSVGGGFAIHTVQTNSSSDRPIGSISPNVVDRLVTQVFNHSVQAVGYDALLDKNTGFWVGDLDQYILDFQRNGVPILPIEWTDVANDKVFYSFQVQVASTNVILEFMSGKQTILPARRHFSSIPRFIFRKGETPESIFGDLTAISPKGGKPYMHAARVSHYTSNLARDLLFYRDGLNARIIQKQTSAGVKILALDFANIAASPNYVQLHLVQRLSTNTTGWLKVEDLEGAMNSLHAASIKTDTCGYDQWMDSHYSLNSGNDTDFSVGVLAPKLRKFKQRFHLLGPPEDQPYPANMTTKDTLYVTTPNGITVEIKNILRGEYSPRCIPIPYGVVGGLCGVGNCSCGTPDVAFV